ncbi:transcription initiation factor TFIID subunit 4-like isoform X2 [Melanotaenia boesemani]|uniref:transcription initiation factor TFIID subunit 4-like isoform X2 n=1 Tax=Melanotaenia boesemani TaxID=1250792 RepID=UPI001C04B814|nr:transcription initiation factor TFIID subunit 4-like isoform X2 [Melanotaenia boesemani]
MDAAEKNMITGKAINGDQKLDSCGAPVNGDPSVQVRIMQVPAKCGPITAVKPSPSAASNSSQSESVAGTGPHKVISNIQGYQPASSSVPGPLTTSSVMVFGKTTNPGGVGFTSQQVAVSQVPSISQVTTPGRTVVITVPRSAVPQPAAPALPQAASQQLPSNIQIPPGMMLIRSDGGQLMLVTQQALTQAQLGSRIVSSQAPKTPIQQVSTAVGNKNTEKVTVIRMATTSTCQPGPVQKTAVVIGVTPKSAVPQNLSSVSEQGSHARTQAAPTDTKRQPPRTFSQETLESVKKCKNFLITLIKLASSDSRSASMANNVRGLVRSLLEGRMEAEEFTEQLYDELKSTPQPCLVPFLKKSLPAVRSLTADPQLFIQQASISTCNQTTQSSSTKQSISSAGQIIKTSQQGIQHAEGVAVRPGLMTLAQSRNYISKRGGLMPRYTLVQSGKHISGSFSMEQTVAKDPPHSTKFAFKENSGSCKDDDDINDVASMAGVNLREENAQILTTTVGSVVQSCQDQLFLSPQPMRIRILHAGQALGVTDVGPEVVALVSHATQECLRGLLEKLTVIAEHGKATLKEDQWHTKVSDVRSQLRFLEEIEMLKKKRKDEEERYTLMRLAKSRSHTEDPQLQQLKQRARELQQIEAAQLQQREANITALAAIGPRKKRPLDQMESQVSLLPRQDVRKVTRVMLKDLLVCMEQEPFLRHSLILYKAMLSLV